MGNIALGIIDLQFDFVMGNGKLPVPDGMGIICPTRRLVMLARKQKVRVFFSCDQHHSNDPEFEVWPPHCIAGTDGANFVFLTPQANEIVIAKGSFQYSAFAPRLPKIIEHLKYQAEDRLLAIALNKAQIDTLILTGLAYDFCVGETALDAISSGLGVFIVEDCTRAVARPDKNGGKNSKEAMRVRLDTAGVKHIALAEALKMLT